MTWELPVEAIIGISGAVAAAVGWLARQNAVERQDHALERTAHVTTLTEREREFDQCIQNLVDRIVDLQERSIRSNTQVNEALLTMKGALNIYGQLEKLRTEIRTVRQHDKHNDDLTG